MSKKVFLCASTNEDDQKILKKLDSHLSSLKRNKKIEVFYGNEIDAGSDRKKVIKGLINKSDYILLLISSNFWDSDFYYDVVLQEALKHVSKTRSKAKLIPIFGRAFSWVNSPLGKYIALPNRKTPIASTTWGNTDTPYKYIVDSLENVIDGGKLIPYPEDEIGHEPKPPIVEDDKKIGLAIIAKGNKAYRLQNFEEAKSFYEQAKRYLPNDGAPYFNIGQCHRRLGEDDKAMELYREALAVDPKYGDAHNLMGFVFENKKNYSEALKSYMKAVKYNPKNSKYLFRVAYLLHYKLERFDEALSYYEKVIQLRPEDVETYFNIGYLYYKQDKDKLAMSYFAKTIEIDPGYYRGFSYIGYIYYNKGNYREARKQFDFSLKIKPDQDNVIKYRKKADSNIW